MLEVGGVTSLLLFLSATGTMYFLFNWLYERKKLKNLSYIDARRARIDEEVQKERKGNLRRQINLFLTKNGYDGDPGPFLVTLAFVFSLSAAILGIIFAEYVAILLAIPVSLGASISVLQYISFRRLEKGSQQIGAVIRAAINHLKEGATPQQAFTKAAEQVGSPIRDDILRAVASQVGAVGLGEAMSSLARKYPSQATSLLVSALEVNDKVGAELVPALEQADIIIRRKKELAAEATAEIASARSEFLGITIIVSLITGLMVVTAGDAAQIAYTSAIGITLLTVAILNYAFGVWRTLRFLSKTKRGDL